VVVGEEAVAGHPAVEHQALGQVADHPAHREIVGAMAVDGDASGVGTQEPEQAAEQRGLAGAVRPMMPNDSPAWIASETPSSARTVPAR
jgi:hypothetical protein